MSYITEAVPPEHIHHVWADAWPWLEKAIERFPEVRTPPTHDEVLVNATTGKAQLWIAWDTETDSLAGAVTTQIKTHNDMLLLEIPLLGGRDFMKWGHDMWNTLKSFGRSVGCTHAVGYGRKGWRRFCTMIEVGTAPSGVVIMGCPLWEGADG